MKQFYPQEELMQLVGMYFDQVLDPQSRDEFLQKVNTDPTYQQAFQHEQAIRERIKQHVYRPGDSSQLIRAIKNQIGKG